MEDVQMTVCGWVGTDPEFHSGSQSHSAQGFGDRVTFRLGSTPRFFDRGQNAYRDQETVWLTVKAWRALAHHVASSVHKGEPVVVVGRMRTQVWLVDGEERRGTELEATSVGHDLAKGTSAFRRASRSGEQRPAEPASEPAQQRQESSWPETAAVPGLRPVPSDGSGQAGRGEPPRERPGAA